MKMVEKFITIPGRTSKAVKTRGGRVVVRNCDAKNIHVMVEFFPELKVVESAGGFGGDILGDE